MKTRRISYQISVVLFGVVALSFVPCADAYNKSWDQGHTCINPSGGATGWGRYDYNGTFKGSFTSKDCCELLCKICPVYANTGRLQKTFTDLSVPGVGPTLAITRTYQSQTWASSLVGNGWMLNFGKQLIVQRNKAGDRIIVIRQETGELNFFKENSDGTLGRLSEYGMTYEIIRNANGTYTLVARDGTVQDIASDGKTLRVIDKNGNQLTFQYNADGCLNRITNASGNFIDFQMGPNGKIASIADNLGRTVSYAYDGNGNLISSSDPLGHATQYAYDGQNRLTSIRDPRGNTVLAVTYDTFEPARVATMMEKGETWTITYNAGNTVKRDSAGHTWTYYYNNLGIIEKTIDPLGNVVEQSHNKVTSTSLAWKQDANGNRTTFTYDADGNIASKTDPLGNTWRYTYVAGTDHLATETNPLGVVTKYEYDANGNRIKLIRDFGGPLENAINYTYDAKGNQTSVTDPLGNVTRNEYDASGNVTKITNPLGNITQYTYDNRGNRITETNALGNVTRLSYDLMNHLTSTTDALGNVTTYTYDANGNRVTATNPLGHTTTYAYDTYNRLAQVTDPLGNRMVYTYDSKDKMLTMTDGNGNVTSFQYDVVGRKTSVTDALGHNTTFGYEANGNLSSQTDAKGNRTEWTYDTNNRLMQTRYADGAVVLYTYDVLGRKITETDANGNTTTFSYDTLNGLVSKTFQDNSKVMYTYNALGRMLTGVNAGNTLTYVYDAAGRVTQSTQNGKMIAYRYDAIGNRVSLTTPEGETIQYAYDAAGRMTRMQLSNGKGISYSYNSVGRVIRKDYAGGSWSNYVYDASGRLTQLRHMKTDGTIIYEQANTFDIVGNITSKTTGSGTTNYAYDAVYQLLSADHPVQSDETFTYDSIGNRLTSAQYSNWSYNSRNELTGFDGTAFVFDSNGNAKVKTDSSGTTNYSYDFENRLKQLNFPDGNNATYDYDVEGRRTKKNIGGSVEEYIYDKDSLIGEYDSTGKLARNYLQGVTEISPSALWENGKFYLLYADHLGVPVKVMSENGNLVWAAEYSAFGQAIISQEDITVNMRFPGQYFDTESGQHYNYFRYFMPDIGRYSTADPIGYKGGANLYVYVLNNPVIFVDPTGLVCGPNGWKDWLVPDWIVGVFDFTNACENHDCCYGCYVVSKSQCDSNFLNDMQNSCSTTFWLLRLDCYGYAYKYYLGVHWFGGSFYKKDIDYCCTSCAGGPGGGGGRW